MRGWVLSGDVVESRRYRDARALLAGLGDCLERVNQVVVAVRPLRLDAGDEFSGTYAGLTDVVTAALRLRLVTDDLVIATVDDEDEPVDVRVGIAAGSIDDDGTPDPAVVSRAIEARRQAQVLPARAKWPPSLRTVVAGDDEQTAVLNAHLMLQDQLLARMDASDRRALLGLLDGERQVDIAADLGVTQPAIARRVRDRGALAISRALRVMARDSG